MADSHELPIFWIEETDEEHKVYSVGEKEVADVNHDEHGWSGMMAVDKVFRKIAKQIGATVKEK